MRTSSKCGYKKVEGVLDIFNSIGYYLLLPKLTGDEFRTNTDKESCVEELILGLANAPFKEDDQRRYRRLLCVVPKTASVFDALEVLVPYFAKLENGEFPETICPSIDPKVAKKFVGSIFSFFGDYPGICKALHMSGMKGKRGCFYCRVLSTLMNMIGIGMVLFFFFFNEPRNRPT